MANINTAIRRNLFDNILPTIGKPRVKVPVWDNSQKMFIFDEYESAQGHRYYRGVRFCDNLAIVEKVGLYHNWTYIDGIDIYAFNGSKPELIQKRDFEKVFRSEEFVREQTIQMVTDFISGSIKMLRASTPKVEIETKAKAYVDACYKSFLDSDYNTRLMQIIPALESR